MKLTGKRKKETRKALQLLLWSKLKFSWEEYIYLIWHDSSIGRRNLKLLRYLKIKIQQCFSLINKNIRQCCVHCAVRMWSPLWRCKYPVRCAVTRAGPTMRNQSRSRFCRGAHFQVAGKQKVVGPIILKRGCQCDDIKELLTIRTIIFFQYLIILWAPQRAQLYSQSINYYYFIWYYPKKRNWTEMTRLKASIS